MITATIDKGWTVVQDVYMSAKAEFGTKSQLNKLTRGLKKHHADQMWQVELVGDSTFRAVQGGTVPTATMVHQLVTFLSEAQSASQYSIWSPVEELKAQVQAILDRKDYPHVHVEGITQESVYISCYDEYHYDSVPLGSSIEEIESILDSAGAETVPQKKKMTPQELRYEETASVQDVQALLDLYGLMHSPEGIEVPMHTLPNGDKLFRYTVYGSRRDEGHPGAVCTMDGYFTVDFPGASAALRKHIVSQLDCPAKLSYVYPFPLILEDWEGNLSYCCGDQHVVQPSEDTIAAIEQLKNTTGPITLLGDFKG